MAFIETIPVDRATDDVRKMYEDVEAQLGYVPNYAKAFSHRPEVMGGWATLLGSIRGNLDPRRYELVTLAAARALQSSYCMLAHGSILERKYLPADELRSVAEGSASPLEPVEAAIMEFAEKVVRDASAVRREDVDALRAHGLDDAEIFDVAAAAAARCFFSKLLDALGAEPDQTYQALPEGVRQALTVGRDISDDPVEKLPE